MQGKNPEAAKRMTEEPRVIDGADRRKKRLLDLLAYIVTNKGATTSEILGFCTVKFGLTNKTGATYIKELHLAKMIALDGVKWQTTRSYERVVEYLYG